MSQWIAFFAGILASASISAAAVELRGSVPITINIDELSLKQKTVYVQKIQLSTEAQMVLKERLEDFSTHLTEQSFSITNSSSSKIYLGMNGTPVLDQGVHASCVTFVITASVDALIGKGDYISQLCSLELGDYLKRHGKTEHSGWNGSYGTLVLNQLQNYGLVSKAYQKEFGCAGVKKYPLYDEKNTGKPMSISEYTTNASDLSRIATWETLVDVEQSFTKNHNSAAVLHTIKKNLREGRRVAFGMLLDDSVDHAGALGTYKKRFDSWVLTPEIIYHAKNGEITAGHEMIIIGYDDSAKVSTEKGKISRGIFILRNSWGKELGDKGNYYISYDYFKMLSDEVHVIIPVK